MSVSMMFLALNFLLEGDFKSAWKRLRSNAIGWFILGFFLLHVIALLWTSNFEYAMNDLRIKLPLLVIPIILIARPLRSRNDLHIPLIGFLVSTALTSLINYAMYQHWIGNYVYDDIRGMSLFGSHVRFANIISMCVGICLYFFKYTKWLRIGFLILISWFTYYTFYSQVISGAATLAAVFLVFIIYLLWGKFKLLAIFILGTSFVSTLVLLNWLFAPVSIDMDAFRKLPSQTAEGHPYVHYNRIISPESGEPIYWNFCEEELVRDWPKRSKIPYYGNDGKNQPIRFTLLRYLASRKLPKDASGIAALSDKEIRTIESGIGSSQNFGLMGRLYSIKYHILNGRNPNENSMLERIEYWRAGFNVFSENWIVGVGTGDVQHSFDIYYSRSDSKLKPENRRRAHNMFLTVALSFGIFGLLIFISFQFYFLRIAMQRKEVLMTLFLAVACVSFLMEDTLETQTGVTFCAFFYSLFANRIPSISSREQ